MLIQRTLHLPDLLGKKSQFLFGPRQTGKTSLIRETLPNCRNYNLLDFDTFLRLNQNPGRLREELKGYQGIVVIDEIQKLPILLDEVQIMIEEQRIHFLLTGSSARKLKRSGVNLLGGRARTVRMHPLTTSELADKFDLMHALNFGTLPAIYFSEDPALDLKAYAGQYLKEEIAAEGLTRNVPAFSRFLETAALCNGQIINYQAMSSDAAVPRTTVQEYFSILKDTLIAEEVESWRKTRKRKAVTTSKFYFFDVGVANHLQHTGRIEKKSKLFGEAFEAFMFQELAAYRDYISHGSLHYWRSEDRYEVDFILDDSIAIEVKGTNRLTKNDFKGIRALQSERSLKHHVIVCLEPVPRDVEGIQVIPWDVFLKDLWSGKFK